MSPRHCVEGWAVVVRGTRSKPRLCFTSGPLTDGSVWQIYKTEEEAREFCELKFVDAKYEVLPVDIEWNE